MNKYLTLVLLLASTPAFAHVGHAHIHEHGIAHHMLGTEQWLLGLSLVLVAGLVYWLRPRW
jgi:hypothetical protein